MHDTTTPTACKSAPTGPIAIETTPRTALLSIALARALGKLAARHLAAGRDRQAAEAIAGASRAVERARAREGAL